MRDEHKQRRSRVEPILSMSELLAGQREVERQAERTVALLELQAREAQVNAAQLMAAYSKAIAEQSASQLRLEEARAYLKNLRGVSHA